MKLLPFGYDCYIAMVKPWPIEIDGLPFLKMVDLSMANCRFLFHLEPVDEAILESLPGKAFGTTQKADHDWAMTTG